MPATDVLQMLTNSATKLSNALRSAVLLPEVQSDQSLLNWLRGEASGWDPADVPEYRIRTFDSVGNASNGAWRHHGARVPITTFSEDLRKFAATPIRLVQSVGTFEELLASNGGDLALPWPDPPLLRLNQEIQQGGTGVDSSYRFESVHREVPRAFVQEILEHVRHEALERIAMLVPREQLEARAGDAMPAQPTGVAVQGSGNQIIVSSPGTSATLHVSVGDRVALDEALAGLGFASDQIAQLHEILEAAADDQQGTVMRALAWCRAAATALGVNTAGSAAATLILQYLGQL